MPSFRRLAVPSAALAALVVGLALPSAAAAASAGPTSAAAFEPQTSTQQPGVPGDPGVPEEPGGPEPVPGGPVEPSLPGEPAEPEQPAPLEPSQPVLPGQPTLPQPTQSQPAQTQPAQPVQPPPGQPQPAQPQQPTLPAPGGGQPGGTSSGAADGSGSRGSSTAPAGSTSTSDAGVSAPLASAPGRTALATSTGSTQAVGTRPIAAGAASASVFLTRQAEVEPDSLTVELARFYGVGFSYTGFSAGETVAAMLRDPAGTKTPLPVQPSIAGRGSAAVPTAMITRSGAYTVDLTGDRGVSTKVGFRLAASSGIGLLLEPRELGDGTVEAPRGAVWGFDADEEVAVGAFRTTGDRAALAAGDVVVQADAIGWGSPALGDAIVAEPDSSVYCVVAFGRESHRTAAVTVSYRDDETTAAAWEAPQVCGSAISAARSAFMTTVAAPEPAGITPTTALMIGGGAVAGSLLACAVVLVVLLRRRAITEPLLGGPQPRTGAHASR